MSEWSYLRAAFVVVGLMIGVLGVIWLVDIALYEDRGFEQTRACLEVEKGLTLETPRDPIARSAELGALRTIIETNGLTISVAKNRASAERIVAAYRRVAADLEDGRLERRGRIVLLWDRPASPTQRQTVYDCEY